MNAPTPSPEDEPVPYRIVPALAFMPSARPVPVADWRALEEHPSVELLTWPCPACGAELGDHGATWPHPCPELPHDRALCDCSDCENWRAAERSHADGAP